MTRATIDDVKTVPLDQLPVSLEDRATLESNAGIHGAIWVDGSAVVFGPVCHLKSEAKAIAMFPGAALVWRRNPNGNRVSAALALMRAEGITAHAAAKRVGVNVSAVYRAQTLREERGVCPHCGQPMPTMPGDL